MQFFTISPLKENINNLMRRAGYHFIEENQEKKELNFVRPIERSGYPRFHLFIKSEKEKILFSLHLDQKRPVYPVRKFSTSNGVYKGLPAHQGEYNGSVVEVEVERIKQIFNLWK